MRTFLLKIKHFFKRNIYPITVTMCTVLVLGIIAVSAYSSIKSNNVDVVVNTDIPSNEGTNVEDHVPDDSEKKDDGEEVSSTDVIIFELPFEGAMVSKEYSDTTLLYDTTSKFWCTHQGLDFACNEGQQILAVFDGIITKIENSMMYGTVVYLKVSDELTVIYKGLSSSVSVSEGDNVKKGALIGTATTSLFEKADGVHLHLELTKGDELIDPTDYFSFDK